MITTYGLATRDLEALAGGRASADLRRGAEHQERGHRKPRGARPPARRLAMTGTPVENRLSELWSLMEFTNPGLLGSAE